MATTIDSLDIQISTSLKQTDKDLDNLINKLGVVSSSLMSIGGKSTNAVAKGFNQVSVATAKSQANFKSFASVAGKFYASYFLVIRGIKSLWGSIEKTADYIEAFNYFNVTMGKIGSDWSHQYEQYGYENAEAYAESFATRLTQNLSGLSGVQIDSGTGLLSETGTKNLGLNIREITQYAAQLSSTLNAVGQNAEISLAATSAFTKLAADISSLRNVEYSTAANTIQSVIQGQSRAGYKFGWDTTAASLQALADELDLSKPVSEMEQYEKQQLRMLAILRQSSVAFGDLANTIESPSNLMRQLTNNIEETGMILGQLFIPLVTKALPVINGFTIAIKRLLVSTANVLGVELDLSSFGQGYSELEEDVSGVTDEFDDLTNSVKKAKNALRGGIDELKVINTSGSLAGSSENIDLTNEILAATENYQQAWNEAFAKMENRAEEFASKITTFFSGLTVGFDASDYTELGNALDKISAFSSDVFENFYTNFLQPVSEWSLGEGLPKLADSLAQLINGIDWEGAANLMGEVFENLRLRFEGVATVLTNVVGEIAPKLAPIINNFISRGQYLYENVLNPLWSFINTNIMPFVERVLIAGLNNLLDFFEEFTKGVETTFGGVILFVSSVFKGDWETAWEAIKQIFDGTIGTIYRTAKNTIKNILSVFSGLEGASKTLQAAWEKVSDWFSTNVFEPLKTNASKILAPLKEPFETALKDIKAIWNGISAWFNTYVVTTISNTFSKLKTIIPQVFKGSLLVIQATWQKVSEWFNDNVVEKVQEKFEKVSEYLEEPFETAVEHIQGFFTTLWQAITKGIVSAMNGVIGTVENGINFVADGINGLLGGFNSIVGWAAKVLDKDWNNVELVSHVSLGQIQVQGYEVGGFPKPYSLFAAGEGGIPELMGTVGGRTAVAGGAEITGIRDEIRATANEEIALLRQQNILLQGILEKEFGISQSDIGQAAQSWGRDYARRTGRNAYNF